MVGRARRQAWRRRGYSRRAIRLLEPALLLLLHHGTAHGYRLVERLGEFRLGNIDPSAVYRTLRDMEAKGWVVSSWEEEQTQGPPRRVYRLAQVGDQVLRWWTQDLQETRRLVDYILDTYVRHMEEGQGDYH
jgi:DNA-binding PadR family transcriptional regulator